MFYRFLLYYKTDSTYYNQILYTELGFDLSLTEKSLKEVFKYDHKIYYFFQFRNRALKCLSEALEIGLEYLQPKEAKKMESVRETLETGGHPNKDDVETIGCMITSKKPALESKGLHRH